MSVSNSGKLGSKMGKLGSNWVMLGSNWGKSGSNWATSVNTKETSVSNSAMLGSKMEKLGNNWAMLGNNWGKLESKKVTLGSNWEKLGCSWGKLGSKRGKMGSSPRARIEPRSRVTWDRVRRRHRGCHKVSCCGNWERSCKGFDHRPTPESLAGMTERTVHKRKVSPVRRRTCDRRRVLPDT
jgi:hypothetical protein